MELDHAFIPGHPDRPARPSPRELGKDLGPAGIDPLPRQQLDDLGEGTGWKNTRWHRDTTVGQHDERVRLGVVRTITRCGCGSSRVLSGRSVLVAQASDVGDHCDATLSDRRLRFRNACSESSWNSGALSGAAGSH